MQTERPMLEVAISYQRMLADTLPVLVMMADPDGTVNYFNRAWFEYTGQEPFERDIEANWTRFIHPDDLPRVAEHWVESVKLGRDVIDMEYRLREATTGTYRWVKARATALRDERGEIVQWIGTAMDIDEARRTNAAISEMAEAYQSASLPVLEPMLNGMRFSVAYRAATTHFTACGDWYDAFPLSEGATAVCVGDVAGHGLQAATLMSQYRQSLRAIALRAMKMASGGPESVLLSVEETIALEHREANATAFFGVISADKRSLQWSNAGHVPPLLVYNDGRTAWLQGNEPPLGWRFGLPRTTTTTDITDARALVLYTDGLVEASRNLIEGMRQLEANARRAVDSGNTAVYLLDSWKPVPTHDDVAILAVRF